MIPRPAMFRCSNETFPGCHRAHSVRPYKLLAGLVAVSAVFSSTTSNPAFAQNSASTPIPDGPPATLCTAEAPSFEHLNALLATPIAATPVPQRTPGTVPEGTQADVETTAAVNSVIRELVGCYNAGDLLRSYGLYTESYLAHLFGRQGGFNRAEYDFFATPQPTDDPSRHTSILNIADVRLFEDGTA